MKKKIIITSMFLLIVCIAVFFYLYNKQIHVVKTKHYEYAQVIFKGSKYEYPIFIDRGSTLRDALLKLQHADPTNYSHFTLNKTEVTLDFKIFKDCIFKVT